MARACKVSITYINKQNNKASKTTKKNISSYNVELLSLLLLWCILDKGQFYSFSRFAIKHLAFDTTWLLQTC